MTQHDHIHSLLAPHPIPAFGNPNHPLDAKLYDPDTETTETVLIEVGDVIETNSSKQKPETYRVIIDLMNDYIIYFVPRSNRYQALPLDFLEEDLENDHQLHKHVF